MPNTPGVPVKKNYEYTLSNVSRGLNLDADKSVDSPVQLPPCADEHFTYVTTLIRPNRLSKTNDWMVKTDSSFEYAGEAKIYVQL